MSGNGKGTPIYERPVELLQQLIRFDTTNPPGNERACIQFIQSLMNESGIQTYGFTPLKLPEDFNFVRTVHAADERVPVEALDFGVRAIFSALQQFH